MHISWWNTVNHLSQCCTISDNCFKWVTAEIRINLEPTTVRNTEGQHCNHKTVPLSPPYQKKYDLLPELYFRSLFNHDSQL